MMSVKTKNNLTDSEKLSYILKTELKITEAIMRGHKASDTDEFNEERKLIEKYRKELKIK
jgi:hypothetical protein